MRDSPSLLIIDDDDAIRRLCKRLLERMNFNVLEAECGETGMSVFNAHADEISFILLDLNLPDASGRELAETFRTSRPGLPIVYFSGSVYAETADQQDGPQRYFLKKPFTKASLETLLSELKLSPKPAQE